MEPHEVEHIFHPFWQADNTLTRTTGGSGLGLAISQRYLEMFFR